MTSTCTSLSLRGCAGNLAQSRIPVILQAFDPSPEISFAPGILQMNSVALSTSGQTICVSTSASMAQRMRPIGSLHCSCSGAARAPSHCSAGVTILLCSKLQNRLTSAECRWIITFNRCVPSTRASPTWPSCRLTWQFETPYQPYCTQQRSREESRCMGGGRRAQEYRQVVGSSYWWEAGR